MKHGIQFMALLATLITGNKEIARGLYEQVINQGKLDLLEQWIAGDYETPDGKRGPAAFRATVNELRAGFSDIHFTVHDVIAEGDRVVIRWTWEGTHTGTFKGNAATHKRITNSGIVIYQFRDGKVVKNWLETDRLGALQQMGLSVR